MKIKKMNQCNETRFGEFPDIFFGKSVEDEMVYFNATSYINLRGKQDKELIDEFQKRAEYFIEAIREVYSIPHEDLIVKDESSGDLMVEESLTILFVSFLDPGFVVYMIERMEEMLLNGIVASDTHIARCIRDRFTREQIDEIFDINMN